MPEKQKTHNWTKTQTILATGAMFGLMGLFNVIASFDRHKVDDQPVVATPTLSAPHTFAAEAVRDSWALTPVSANSTTRTRSS